MSGYLREMARADPEKLAAALRENLRRRKAKGRAPEPSFGADEEGDFPTVETTDEPADKRPS
ncbi:hypothetical protein BH09PSE3_BH09PSE3_05140 [soil metagenome]